MTVTFKEEIPEARRARNSKGRRTYTRAFRLETSLQSETAYDVGSHASLPVIGDTFPSDANAYCHDIQIDNTDPWKGWIATYEYSDEQALTPAAQAGTGVIDEIMYEFSSQIYQGAAEIGRKISSGGAIGPNQPMVNTAGKPYPDALFVDKSSLIIKIKFNIVAVPAEVLTYLNTFNDSAISINGLSIPKWHASLKAIQVGRREVRGVYATGPLSGQLITYYPVTYEIHATPEEQTVFRVEKGYMCWDSIGADKKLVHCVDDQLIPSAEPMNLDYEGRQLDTKLNPIDSRYLPSPDKDYKLLTGVD